MKPTLKHIAEKAGVSVPTVSMAIHGKGRITAETRQRVLDCATELGYPIHLRRRQAQQALESKTVALLFNVDAEWGFIWVFIRPVVQEIEASMREAGFTIAIIPITNDMADEKIMRKITDVGAKSVFAMHFGDAPLFTTLEKNGIPVILVMNNEYQDRFHSICSDDFQGAYEGTRHLITLGHHRLAYVETERPNLPRLLHDRLFGFRKALAEHEIPFSRNLTIRYRSGDEHHLRGELATMLSLEEPPTAFFCLDDELATHVVAQLEQLGIRVPKDVSVMAPGDVMDYDLAYNRQITTMRINTTQMGKAAASMMLARIGEGDDDVMVVKVRQQLVERGSCAALPGAAPSGYMAP
jgi:DNA-binding LacI/PurR family transcriptional regulator